MRYAAMWALSGAVAAALALAPSAQAQTTQTSPPKAGSAAESRAGSADKKIAGADQKFMMKAASGGKAEVELGRLASERGSSDAVKQFGQRMVTDHGKANKELAQLAQQKGVTLPTGMDANHKKTVDRLSRLSGAEFDRAYSREMQKDHDTDVKEFTNQAKNGKDPDLKSWAAQTLPVLQEHQQQARQLNASVGVSPGRRASQGTSPGGSASQSSTSGTPAASTPGGSGTSGPSGSGSTGAGTSGTGAAGSGGGATSSGR